MVVVVIVIACVCQLLPHGFATEQEDLAFSNDTSTTALSVSEAQRIVTAEAYSGGIEDNYMNAEGIYLDCVASVEITTYEYSVYYKFVPPVTGEYLFFTNNAIGDPFLSIYDSDLNYITSDDDSAGGWDAMMALTLMAGEWYYIRAIDCQGQPSSYLIHVWMAAEISNGLFHLRNDATSKYMDIHGPSNTGLIHQWTYHTASQARWNIVPEADGYYSIRSEYGQCNYLGISNTAVNQDNVRLYATNSDNTKWKIYASSSGTIMLQPKSAAGKVLFVPDSSTGTELQLTWMSSSVGGNQWWTIEFRSTTDLEGQQMSLWCWAATARMMVKHYYDVPSGRSQSSGVSSVWGYVRNVMGSPAAVTQITSFYYSGDKLINEHNLETKEREIYDETTLRRFLDEGHVVHIIRGSYVNGVRQTGHSTVIVGYTTIYKYGAIQYRYIIYDPAPTTIPDPWEDPTVTAGQIYNRSYQWICNGRNVSILDPRDSYIWEGAYVFPTAYSDNTCEPMWEIS